MPNIPADELQLARQINLFSYLQTNEPKNKSAEKSPAHTEQGIRADL